MQPEALPMGILGSVVLGVYVVRDTSAPGRRGRAEIARGEVSYPARPCGPSEQCPGPRLGQGTGGGVRPLGEASCVGGGSRRAPSLKVPGLPRSPLPQHPRTHQPALPLSRGEILGELLRLPLP